MHVRYQAALRPDSEPKIIDHKWQFIHKNCVLGLAQNKYENICAFIVRILNKIFSYFADYCDNVRAMLDIFVVGIFL
jgi:hypothetical protein